MSHRSPLPQNLGVEIEATMSQYVSRSLLRSSPSPTDPSIKPVPTQEVDPTRFEKRFLRKIRDLGEVRGSLLACR